MSICSWERPLTSDEAQLQLGALYSRRATSPQFHVPLCLTVKLILAVSYIKK